MINFGFKFYHSGLLVYSNSVPSDCEIFNHSYNFIQSFIYSVFHPTILLPRGHGAIFTCDFDNLLKTSSRKLSHVPRLYFGNLNRAFKKSNNYVASHINALWTLIVLRHLWTVWGSLLLGKSTFTFKQLVNLLQIGAIAERVVNTNTIRSPCWKLFAMPMTS